MKTDTLLKPGSTIGILGGGQLGRMLALAAAPLGFHIHIYAPEDNPPAAEVSKFCTQASYEDLDALQEFARTVDFVTYEFENVPAQALYALMQEGKLFPPVKALEVTQDRLVEKEFLRTLSLPVADFYSVANFSDFKAAVEQVGYPAILKTRRFGYDGKGQVRVRAGDDLEEIYKSFEGVPAVLEAFVSFEAEISVVMARGRDGTSVVYDISRNDHVNQILHTSTVPSGLPENVLEDARRAALLFANAIDYVGVFAVEFFYCGNSDTPLIVNEIAPRVHNTGHWTLDACQYSQFENHIRAVAGWPLGHGERHSDAVMTNLIGQDIDEWERYAQEPNAKVHLYGKTEARDGRKMGHVTIIEKV